MKYTAIAMLIVAGFLVAQESFWGFVGSILAAFAGLQLGYYIRKSE